MRRALARDFASIPSIPTRVLMTLDHRLPDDPGPWEVVRVGEGEELEVVRFHAARADFTLVIAPETGGILQNWAAELERDGIRSLGSNSTAIGIAGDKLLLAGQLRERGIPTPRTRFLGMGQPPPMDAEYPAVIKPIDGAGACETYFVEGPNSPHMLASSSGHRILQPYIPGEPMSASYFVDGDGNAHKIANGRQNLVVRENRFEYRGGELPAQRTVDEGPLRSAIAAIPGLRGFVGVDFVSDPQTGATTVIEINPRPTTSCVGLCRLLPPGHLSRAWLAACGGVSFNRPDLFANLADSLAACRPIFFAADGAILPRNDEVS